MTIKDATGATVIVNKTARGQYTPDWSGWLIGNLDTISLTPSDDTSVIVLDKNSDGYACFGVADTVQIGDVILTSNSFSAPNVEALKQAVRKVSFVAWDSRDI